MHTMWKGSISFGLVNIPIKMFAATEDRDIRFKYLHKECNTPIKYEKKCPTCNREITSDEIVRGYEYEPGKYIIITDEDFQGVKTEKNRKAIEILDFVNLREIDPIYFDKTYYLSPQETGGKAYSLLRKAMEDTEKVAVAKITIRDKESLAVLRVYKNLLVLETIFYPDEVRDISQVPGVPEGDEVDKKELDMAIKLIENLTEKFNPEKYKDDYRLALMDLINKKIQGQEIEIPKEAPQRNVIDLMEALQASLKETNKKATGEKKRRAKKAEKDKDKKTTAS